MANVKELKVGQLVKIAESVVDPIKMMTKVFSGTDMNGYGEVRVVEPTSAQISEYPEINPEADGDSKAIFYDELAERHFIMPIMKLDPKD